MSLLSRGDTGEDEHTHVLPSVPTAEFDRVNGHGVAVGGTYRDAVRDAVADCSGCGRLFVTRLVDDGYSYSVQWVPLRWWHRRARRLLGGGRKP